MALRSKANSVAAGQLTMPALHDTNIVSKRTANAGNRTNWLEGCDGFLYPLALESLTQVLPKSMAPGAPVPIDHRSPVLIDHALASGTGHTTDDTASLALALLTVLASSPTERQRLAELADAHVHEGYACARALQKLQ